MLPSFIIEELKKREREKKEKLEQPQLEIEIPVYPMVPPSQEPPKEEEVRGVVIIDLWT